MARYYNARVKMRLFRLGDLVLKKVLTHVGAMEPNWAGPYKVREIVRPGTYIIADLNGNKLPHPWNAQHLRIYYQ